MIKPTETKRIIKAAGGKQKFCELLGIPYYEQLVNNWIARGLPSRVTCEHFQKIEELRRK